MSEQHHTKPLHFYRTIDDRLVKELWQFFEEESVRKCFQILSCTKEFKKYKTIKDPALAKQIC